MSRVGAEVRTYGPPMGGLLLAWRLFSRAGYNMGDSFGGTVREEAAKHPAFCGSLPNLPHPNGHSGQLILKREVANYGPWAKSSRLFYK